VLAGPAKGEEPGGTVSREGRGPAGEETARGARGSEESGPWSGTVRAGLEYDTNAHRTNVGSAAGDALSRYFAALEGTFETSDGGRLSLRLRHGGKLFAREHAADTLLTGASLRYRHRLGSRAYGIVDLRIKDRIERRVTGADVPHQDYNRGGGEAGIGLDLGPVDAVATVGWRYFAFRPSPSSSNHGPEARVGLSGEPTDRLRLRANYTLSLRDFRAVRFDRVETEGGGSAVRPDASGELRDDRLHVGRVGGTYRGPLIVEAHYQVLRNLSNSYGRALTRHGVELRATAPLPWNLFLSGAGRVQRTSYEDPLFVTEDLRVDEDNRNSLVVSLTRVVGEHWELEGRYRLFIEAFGDASDYRRQTASFGVGYLF